MVMRQHLHFAVWNIILISIVVHLGNIQVSFKDTELSLHLAYNFHIISSSKLKAAGTLTAVVSIQAWQSALHTAS